MARQLTPDTLVYELVAAGDPQVAPDGSRVVYTLARADGTTKKQTSDLWLCGIDGGSPRRLTWGGRNGNARWSPDGTQIAFTSDRVKASGVFVLPVEGGGEARELTRHAQSIGELAWSPDGAQIAYTTLFDPENPDERELDPEAAPRVRVTCRIDYKQDTRGYLGDARKQVFVVAVASGERRRITSALVDHNNPQWSPDGRRLAVRIPNRNGMFAQLGIVHAASGETTLVGPESGEVSVWAWSPDGGSILYAGDTAQTWQTDFFLHDVASGSTRRLTDDLQCLPDAGFAPVLPPSQPIWLDDTHALFHAFRAGASGLYTVGVTSGEVAPIVTWEALHAGLSADTAGRYVAQARGSLDTTGEIVVYDRREGTTQVITEHNAALLGEAPPASWELFDVQRGDYTIEAWLLKPQDFDPGKRYPLILDVHGGPNGHYGYGFNLTQQSLASAGFLVAFANPRGSSSYGRHFTQQVIEDWGGEDFLDLMAVVDAALERPYADSARTGIFGYSYGGYMTAWTIGQTDRFAAAVCGAPVFDCVSMFGTSDIGHAFGPLQFGGKPHERADWYAAHSPSTYAHRVRTPTLILHGEADDRCPIGQGEEMFVALHEAGCEVELVRYPGDSHLMLRVGPPAHRADFLTRVVGWFTSHLGGPA
jgi:dipeptidyl aminopeptidase/acylaminoacyl peptidase